MTGAKVDNIRRQHFGVVYASIILCAGAYYFALAAVPDAAPIASTASALNLSWTAVPALLIGVYEVVGWRLLNAELDYAGYWEGVEEQYRYDGQKQPTFDYPAWCEMRIRQNVRRLAVVEGRTHPGARAEGKSPQTMWYSTACELDAQSGRIVAALCADTSPIRPGGAVESEIETFNVTERGFLGRPTKMQSHVKMTAGTATPRFVLVFYTRRLGPFTRFLVKLFRTSERPAT